MSASGMFDGQWIDVFRAGDYGDKGSYAQADLDQMVQGFESKHPDVPAVVGHPETDSPAYGWVDKVRRVGDLLQVQLKDVFPDFEDAVRKGLYRTRSVAIGADKLLRHIGFLGGATPQVKGLKPVHFGGGEFATFDYKESDMDVVQEVKGALKEFGDKIDKLFAGSGDRKFSEAEARQFAAEKLGSVQADFSAMQKKFDTAAVEFAAAQEEAKNKCPKCGTVFAEKEREAVAQASDFINQLKQSGKWLPAFSAMGAESVIVALAKDGGKMTFGEGDKKTEKPLYQAFSDFILGMEKVKAVPTGRVHRGGGADKTSSTAQFADNPHVDQESVVLNERAEQLAAEKKIPFADALRQVYRETNLSGAAAAAAV